MEKSIGDALEFAQPEDIYLLEPTGLTLTERAKLALPNDNEFPGGTELVILSRSATTGGWAIDGSAWITSGNSIETKDDFGISHFSEVMAIPFNPEIKAVQDTKPLFTSTGNLTKTIELPSYSLLGNKITPFLKYDSNWANPTIFMSNQ